MRRTRRNQILAGLALLFWATRQHVTVAAGGSTISVPVVALVAVVVSLCLALALGLVLRALMHDTIGFRVATRGI